MNIVEIINKKRLGLLLSEEEIQFVVNGFVRGEIPDYQMSALLMAICVNGMYDEEAYFLTEAMLHSGDILDLSSISGAKVDKHSTGGIGDKTTLVLLPLVASCGVFVPKMSGRSLGYTGGTIDKLESIPGFQVNLDFDRFIEQVKNIGCSVVSQMGNLVPADKKIYALRDVTGTVESIPLIASSIMSKKLASGSDAIVIDLKVGNGAFMKNLDDAKKLGKLMVKIGAQHGKKVACVLTNMDEPLGYTIGNALEVKEAMDTLFNRGEKYFTELVLFLGALMVSFGKNMEFDEANRMVKENLENGKAYQKFLEFVKAQGGEIEKLTISSKVISIKSKKTGFVTGIKSEVLGEIVRSMGGGRYEKNDVIDSSVGIVLHKKIGDYVLEDEEIVKVYLGDKDISVNDILECFEIKENGKGKKPLIYGILK